MLRRILRAVLVSAVQIIILWLMFYAAATIVMNYDSLHHSGIGWGLLLYFLFVFSTGCICITNLSSAVVNKKQFARIMMLVSALVLLGMFGANPLTSPYRMIFILAIIILISAGKELLDKIFLRLIPDAAGNTTAC